MWASQGLAEEQAPIAPSRTVASNAMPKPIAILDSFSTMRTNRLLVRSPNEGAGQDKHKDKANNSHGNDSWNWERRLLKRRSGHEHANKNEKQQSIPDNGQDAKLKQLSLKCVFAHFKLHPSYALNKYVAMKLRKRPPFSFVCTPPLYQKDAINPASIPSRETVPPLPPHLYKCGGRGILKRRSGNNTLHAEHPAKESKEKHAKLEDTLGQRA